jgi:hypothetical protein
MTIAEQWLEEGRKEGLEKGLEEGRKEGRIAMLRDLLVCKFGAQSRGLCETMLGTATPEAIDRYLPRVLTADSLVAVFEG